MDFLKRLRFITRPPAEAPSAQSETMMDSSQTVGVTGITPIAAPGAAPTSVVTPTAADVLATLAGEVADLAAKKQAYEDQKAKVAGMRTVWQSAVADVEAAFSGVDDLVGKLVGEVKSLV